MKTNKSWFQRLAEWYNSKQEEAIKSEPNLPVEYSDALTKIADERTNQRFLNDSNSQAELVFWLMLRSLRPNDEVLIYSDALSHPFYLRILAGPCFLKSKPVCKIVLDDKAGIEIIKKLPEDAQRRIDCRLAPTKDGAHMIVTHHAFRFEAKDYHDELFVVCNFNELEVVERLKKRFDRIWENSVPVPVG